MALPHPFSPTAAGDRLERLEDLGVAVLDCQGPADLVAWLG